VHSGILTTGLGCTGVGLGVVITWVQLRRARTVSTDGISLSTWALFVYMSIFWILYGWAIRSPIVTSGSLFVLPLQILIIAKLEPHRHVGTLLKTGAFIFTLSFLPVILWGWKAGCYGTAIVMVLNRLPQIVELIRSADVDGVSVGSWSIGVVACAAWLSYYVGEKLWPPFLATLLALLGNLAIVILASWRHRQHAVARALEIVA